MKSRMIPYLTLFAFSITNIPARADAIAEINPISQLSEADLNALIAQDESTTSSEEDLETPQGQPVSEENENQSKSRNKQMWINIGLAVAAVVVAVVALVVVSNNNGHHYKSK